MNTNLEERVNLLAAQLQGLLSREKGPFYAIDVLTKHETLLLTRIQALQSLVLDLAQVNGIEPQKVGDLLERKCEYFERRHLRDLENRTSVEEAVKCVLNQDAVGEPCPRLCD